MVKKGVEVTVPVYNEEEELEQNISKLLNFCNENLKKYNWHVTIADNASSDNTSIIASGIAKKESRVSYLRLEQKGRGRAVKKAWTESEKEICIYMDMDLSTDLIHLPKIIHALESDYDLAIGSRLAKGANVEGRTFLRELTSRALNFFFIRFFFKTNFTDAQCGFKGVTRKIVDDVIPKVKDNEWFFDGELLIISEKSGYKVYEEPVHWIDNPGSTVRLISTIWGDLMSIKRLLLTKPWKS
jgi:glycosyltransferase involved in cell wall biosynthesis